MVKISAKKDEKNEFTKKIKKRCKTEEMEKKMLKEKRRDDGFFLHKNGPNAEGRIMRPAWHYAGLKTFTSKSALSNYALLNGTLFWTQKGQFKIKC